MAKVSELHPGDIVEGQAGLPVESATFIASTDHPVWPHLKLVVWILDNGSVSLGAVDPSQEIGEVRPVSSVNRRLNLRSALTGKAGL